MYVREGFIADAVNIEQRFATLTGGRPKGEEVLERHRQLQEEDGR